MEQPELLEKAKSDFGRYMQVNRQMDFSSEAQSARGKKSAAKLEAQQTFNQQLYETRVKLSAASALRLKRHDEETGRDFNFIIPVSTKNVNHKDRKVRFTEQEMELEDDHESEKENPISFSVKKLLSLERGIYLHGMWETERASIKKVDPPARKEYNPEKPGYSLPTIDNIQKTSANIKEEDTLYILQQWVKQVPDDIHVLTMIPHDDLQGIYLTNKTAKSTYKKSQILFLKPSLLQYINENYSDHPLAGQLIYGVEEELGLPKSKYSYEIGEILIHLFRQEKGLVFKSEKFGFTVNAKNRKTYTELQR